MKKNKSKVPVVKIDQTGHQSITDSMVDNMCKEFDKMTPAEKEKFKQETLQNLRKSISSIVDGNKERNLVPKNNPKDHYVLNSQNKVEFKKMVAASENNIDDLIKYKPLNEKETELLKSRVSEYLKTFVIFGYDMNSNRILITNSKTVQDNDAIFSMSQHIPGVLFQILNNGHLPENSDMF